MMFTTPQRLSVNTMAKRWNIVFTDVHDQEIFSLKNKHFTIHKSFHAEDPHGHDLFTVKGEFSRK